MGRLKWGWWYYPHLLEYETALPLPFCNVTGCASEDVTQARTVVCSPVVQPKDGSYASSVDSVLLGIPTLVTVSSTSSASCDD